jgi:hypothetical protein
MAAESHPPSLKAGENLEYGGGTAQANKNYLGWQFRKSNIAGSVQESGALPSESSHALRLTGNSRPVYITPIVS